MGYPSSALFLVTFQTTRVLPWKETQEFAPLFWKFLQSLTMWQKIALDEFGKRRELVYSLSRRFGNTRKIMFGLWINFFRQTLFYSCKSKEEVAQHLKYAENLQTRRNFIPSNKVGDLVSFLISFLRCAGKREQIRTQKNFLNKNTRS